MAKRSVKYLLLLNLFWVRKVNGTMLIHAACSRVFLNCVALVVFLCLPFLLRRFFVIVQKSLLMIHWSVCCQHHC